LALSELTGAELGVVPSTGIGGFKDEPFDYSSDGEKYSLAHSAAGFGLCSRTQLNSWQCVY
jgi:hypothetical protein